MRKLSFLTLSLMAILTLSNCTKEDLQKTPASKEVQDPYAIEYSEWKSNSTYNWADGSMYTIPHTQTTWDVPELTREKLDNGSTVLVFTKSDITGAVQQMPVSFVSGPTDNEVDSYELGIFPESFLFTHTRTVDGIAETPVFDSTISFRYIIITEVTPFINGRSPVTDFRSMEYDELIKALNIPG